MKNENIFLLCLLIIGTNLVLFPFLQITVITFLWEQLDILPVFFGINLLFFCLIGFIAEIAQEELAE
ncbi:MAG: hypothetical protein ACFFG0_09640 [Candidatus Thorarchaeota archaeon]